jgi:hypothetical protein
MSNGPTISPPGAPDDSEDASRFRWDDGDVRFLDGDGEVLTPDEIARMQADARDAEVQAEEMMADRQEAAAARQSRPRG